MADILDAERCKSVLVKSFPTSIYYYSVVFSFAKFGFDTAESTAATAENEAFKVR